MNSKSGKIYGNYLGWVVNHTPDPSGRMRVQVFIPHLTNTLYEGWNKNLTNKFFRNPNELGSNTLKTLQQILPWAECAMPIFGGATAMKANATTDIVNVNGGRSFEYEPDIVANAVGPATEQIADMPDQTNNEQLDSQLTGQEPLTDLPQLPNSVYTEQNPPPGWTQDSQGGWIDPNNPDGPLIALPDWLSPPDDSSGGLPSADVDLPPVVSPVDEAAKNPEITNGLDATQDGTSAYIPDVGSGAITQDGALKLSNFTTSSVMGRAKWGSRDRGNYSWFKGMIVHDDGSGGVSTLDGLVSWANKSGLGYTAGIKPNGEWVQFVPFNQQTNHAGSGRIPGAGNSGTIGVILIGVDERVGKYPTQQQYDTLTAAAAALKIQSIGGHGEYTTRKVAGEGLLASQYVRDKLGIGDLTTIGSGNDIDRGTGIAGSLPETAPEDPTDMVQVNIAGNQGSQPDTTIAGNGSPNGFFSVPAYGSKVWVFFYDGDIQRPVYFASVVEPSAGQTT